MATKQQLAACLEILIEFGRNVDEARYRDTKEAASATLETLTRIIDTAEAVHRVR